MSRYSVSFESCIICLRCIQHFISGSNIVHLTLHVPRHLADDTPMLIKGHGCAALEGFWNLAFHLYYMPTFGPASPTTPAAEFAQSAYVTLKIAK